MNTMATIPVVYLLVTRPRPRQRLLEIRQRRKPSTVPRDMQVYCGVGKGRKLKEDDDDVVPFWLCHGLLIRDSDSLLKKELEERRFESLHRGLQFGSCTRRLRCAIRRRISHAWKCWIVQPTTVQARKLEHHYPPTHNLKKQEHRKEQILCPASLILLAPIAIL